MISAITDALDEVGITEAFPIQELTLPIVLTGTDIIGQARTGTGKTLAFGIPLLQRVVSPTDDDFPDLAVPGAPQALRVESDPPGVLQAQRVGHQLSKLATTLIIKATITAPKR